MGRVRISVAVVAALAVLAVQPAPARADTFDNTFFPHHWGPNPYVTLPPANLFYRSVYVIDNTGDPALSRHIQRFTEIINYVHVVYNPNYPVLLYYKDFHLAPGNPCADGPAQFLVVCKDETPAGGGPTTPGTASIATQFASHIFNANASFRPSVVDPWCDADKLTLVVQLLSNTLGLDDNLTNPASSQFPTIPVGRCTANGWTAAEFDRMNQSYSHAVG